MCTKPLVIEYSFLLSVHPSSVPEGSPFGREFRTDVLIICVTVLYSYILRRILCPYGASITSKSKSDGIFSIITLFHSVHVKKPKGHVYFSYKRTSENKYINKFDLLLYKLSTFNKETFSIILNVWRLCLDIYKVICWHGESIRFVKDYQKNTT